MRVLITGAGGFIGRHCLSSVLSRADYVCALSTKERRDRTIDWRHVDILDTARTREIVKAVRPTHLLHLAWVTTPGEYWSSPENLRWCAASLELLRAFQESGGQRVVMAGTCAEYEWSGGRCSERLTPLSPTSLYGSCKHALDVALTAYAARTGLSAAWGRVFWTYGPHEHPARLVATTIAALLAGRTADCTDGTQARDFMFVRDIGDAFAALLDAGVSGPVNVASGEATSIRHVVTEIGDILDMPDRIRLGARPATGDEPAVVYGDPTRLRDELGWTPRFTLRAGLEATIEWWREQIASPHRAPEIANRS